MNVVTRQEAEAYLEEQGGELPPSGIPEDIITDVSARMAEFTGRADWGASEERTEYFDGGSQFVLVNYWPITSISAIYDDMDLTFATDSLIDSDDYHISTKGDGVIFFKYLSTIHGYQNIKVTYTGGYANEAAVPAKVKRAGLLQIQYEVQNRTPGRFLNVPGRYDSAEFNEFEGMSLLGETRALLQSYKRRIPFV